MGNFFDGTYWNFITQNDPTHGYVNYVDKATAASKGYISMSGADKPTYIGCDHTNTANGRGRDSVRVESKKRYDYGLFLLYLDHMPTGCGTWPAWWTYGPSWPNNGEIDIIEQVNEATNDQSTLHTNNGCSFSSAPHNYSGNSGSENCEGNSGCSIGSTNGASFGGAFNDRGGGLFAMEWTSWGIQIWFWSEGDIPANAKSNAPDSNAWGLPFASWQFGGWCPSSHFSQHVVVFDLTFCGDWCGAVFSSECPNDGGNCNSFVQNNPQAFGEAYWDIHWMKVFQ